MRVSTDSELHWIKKSGLSEKKNPNKPGKSQHKQEQNVHRSLALANERTKPAFTLFVLLK